MNMRQRDIFRCCLFALEECWIKDVRDRATFVDWAMQYGSRNQMTGEEVESLMSKSIVDMLECR